MKNEIIIFENQNVKLEVNTKDETVWLSQQQMVELFNSSRTNIIEHINNIYSDEELDKISTCQDFRQVRKEGKRDVTRTIPFYNLDMIISVGYRVNSQKGIIFRRWATNVLKEHLLKGYTVNEKRLEYLEKKVKLIDIATRINKDSKDIKEVLDVINNFSEGLDILDNYDHRTFKKVKGSVFSNQITYDSCLEIIDLIQNMLGNNISYGE